MPANYATRPRLVTQKQSRIGSDFEDFLQNHGRLEESTALALRRVLAWEFNEAMKKPKSRRPNGAPCNLNRI
jgi:hypothetical protein